MQTTITTFDQGSTRTASDPCEFIAPTARLAYHEVEQAGSRSTNGDPRPLAGGKRLHSAGAPIAAPVGPSHRSRQVQLSDVTLIHDVDVRATDP